MQISCIRKRLSVVLALFGTYLPTYLPQTLRTGKGMNAQIIGIDSPIAITAKPKSSNGLATNKVVALLIYTAYLGFGVFRSGGCCTNCSKTCIIPWFFFLSGVGMVPLVSMPIS